MHARYVVSFVDIMSPAAGGKADQADVDDVERVEAGRDSGDHRTMSQEHTM